MKNIGGFFEFEIPEGKTLYHDDAVVLSTGRACLNLMIQQFNFSKYYVPYYCCNALLEPLKINHVNFEFYPINADLEIAKQLTLKPNETIIYCNFFGIKSNYVKQLILKYKNQLIIDNSHAFYLQNYKNAISFTTARKYFGVPDGAFAYGLKPVDNHQLKRNTSINVNHLLGRLLGSQEEAFKQFQDYEFTLNSAVQRISILSEKILKTLDFNTIQKKRNANFLNYHKAFKRINTIKIEHQVKDCFCYPLLLEKPIDRALLIKLKIFIPKYWSDVINRENSKYYPLECYLTEHILPLPIDHRYDKNDIDFVTNAILNLITNG